MKHVLQSYDNGTKPIRMNNAVYYYPIWSENDMDHFNSVLTSLEPYTAVCRGFQADVIATLLLARRFQITYSPLMGERTQPLVFETMALFGPMMASITIEVDFTKLSGGSDPPAANFNPQVGPDKLEESMNHFVKWQLTRSRDTPIQDLRILVRRYHGVRPGTAPPAPYTPMS
ncbi:hypothetical protein BT67DRAFT_364387, partial [Trichocladium antarcticum]